LEYKKAFGIPSLYMCGWFCMVSDVKGGTFTYRFWEQGAEENI
jgi:hypothetical protein